VRFLAFASGFIDEKELLAAVNRALQGDETAPEADLDGVGFANGEALVGAGLKDAQRNAEGNAAAAASQRSISTGHNPSQEKAPLQRPE
jgi:hypothetical protein